jgi:hypothetical protein
MIHRQLTQQLLRSSAIPFPSSLARRYLSFSFTGPKKLSDIMQLEKLTDKSKDEILMLWQQYHATKVSKTPIRTVIMYEISPPLYVSSVHHRRFGREPQENSSCFSFSTEEGRQILDRASKWYVFVHQWLGLLVPRREVHKALIYYHWPTALPPPAAANSLSNQSFATMVTLCSCPSFKSRTFSSRTWRTIRLIRAGLRPL